jgi:hypothetical protein
MPFSKTTSAKLQGLDRSVQLALEVLRELYTQDIPAMAFAKAMDYAFQQHDRGIFEAQYKNRLREKLYDLRKLYRD